MGRLVGHTNHMMTSAAVLLVLSLSLSSVIGETQDRFFFGGMGGFRPGTGGFRPGMGGFGGGIGGFRPGMGGRPNPFGQTLDTLFRDAGVVPEKLASAPDSPMKVFWENEILFRQNQTVDPADIQTRPEVIFPEMFDSNSLNTIMIVDFGAEIMHWMVSNVPGGDISRGDENIEYLTPFSYASNEAHTELVDTGDNGIDATAVLVFRQPGRISVEENLKGCNQGAIFGRRVAAAELVSKYELSGPIAGNLFWTKFSTTTEELLCYMTKCTGVVFPFPIAGVNDGPECSQ